MSKCALLLTGAIVGATAVGSVGDLQEAPPTQEELLEQSRPGPEHERLGRLVGEWNVTMQPAAHGAAASTGEGRSATLLGGRFLVVDFSLGADGAGGAYRYTLGFDRRHDEYSIVVMDTTGTYFVTARGAETDGALRLTGTDDDPLMARMGYEKKFAYELDLGDDGFSVTLHFVDTRTEEEPLIPYATYTFARKAD